MCTFLACVLECGRALPLCLTTTEDKPLGAACALCHSDFACHAVAEQRRVIPSVCAHSCFVIIDRYGAVRVDLTVRFPRFTIILGFIVMAACGCVGQTPSGVETGIEGLITISPTQPGPIRADSPGSGPLASTAFVVENQNGEVASFTTDDQGRFRISLPPGHYKVSVKGKKHAIGHFGPFEVDVVPGKMANVQWECDSGIR
jgi:hypothetical protein